MAFPGHVDDIAELHTALSAQAGEGAAVTVNSISTTLASEFDLPGGTTLTTDQQRQLKAEIATAYGVDVTKVELEGVRRLLQSTDRRQLTETVWYSVTSSTWTPPSHTTLTDAIATGAGVAPDSVSDPAAAPTTTKVEWIVTRLQSTSTDATAVTASMAGDDWSTFATEMGVDQSELVVAAEPPVVATVTTTPAAAAEAGLSVVAAVPVPVWLTTADGVAAVVDEDPSGGGSIGGVIAVLAVVGVLVAAAVVLKGKAAVKQDLEYSGTELSDDATSMEAGEVEVEVEEEQFEHAERDRYATTWSPAAP